MTQAEGTPVRFSEKKIPHNCGIAAVFAPNADVPDLLYTMLFTLQPRGQEGAGMFVQNRAGESLTKKGAGWARTIFTGEELFKLKGIDPILGVGQDRYSTSGNLEAWQPYDGFVHNGNLTNPRAILAQLPKEIQEDAQSDSWIAHQFILHSQEPTMEEKIARSCEQFEGSYNFIMAADNKLFVVRDPMGNRPLVIGQLPNGGYVVASETSAFAPIGARLVDEVREGTGVVIDESGIKPFFLDSRTDPKKIAHCIFEFIYVASPDSLIFGKSVGDVRYECGRELARMDIENGFVPDVVIPVQHSGILATQGYASEMVRLVVKNRRKLGIKRKDLPDVLASLVGSTGLVVNQYAGRIYITPGEREKGAKRKQRGNASDISGKKVAVIDDSLLRGNAADAVVEALNEHPLVIHEAPPDEIHYRVAAPPVKGPCYYGLDHSTRDELIAGQTDGDIEKIRERIHVNSLRYLTHRQLVTAVVGKEKTRLLSDEELYSGTGHCGGCMDGNYPTEIDEDLLFKKPEAKTS